MNSLRNRLSAVFTRPSAPLNSVSWELQQCRGIRVKVYNNNLERALAVMQRLMQSSGVERIIKRQQPRHIKNCEKRVLAKKALQRKVRSQELARKLKSILVKKVRSNKFSTFTFNFVWDNF
nr:30S ribosomal protein [Ipomoea batatas]